MVRLGDRDDSVFIRHMMPVADTIVCDYGNQLRVVKLPVAEKIDWKEFGVLIGEGGDDSHH